MFDTPDPFNPFSVNHLITNYPEPDLRHSEFAEGNKAAKALTTLYHKFLRGRVIWTNRFVLRTFSPSADFTKIFDSNCETRMFVVSPDEKLFEWESAGRALTLSETFVARVELLPLEAEKQFLQRRIIYTIPGQLHRDPMIDNANTFVLADMESTRWLGTPREDLTVGEKAPAALLALATSLSLNLKNGTLPYVKARNLVG